MLIRSLAARIAVSVAAAASLPADGFREQAGSHLTGRVIDGGTGQPVARAIVQLSGSRAVTIESDADGRYQSGPLQPGMYAVTVSRDGYRPAVPLYAGRVPLRLRVREDGAAILRKDWLLEPNARITGRVLNGRGDAVEGVTVIAAVRIANVNGWPQFEIKSSASTRADGRFQISSLARGTYVLVYRLPEASGWFYSPGVIDPRHAAPVEAATGNTAQPVELVAADTSDFSVPVRVLSPSGAPAADAAVELAVWNPFPSMSRQDRITAVTDSAGRATLTGVPAGHHQMRARTPSTARAQATGRASIAIDIRAQPAAAVRIDLQQPVAACLLTRWESGGTTQEDRRSSPQIRASTRDGALAAETIEAQAPLGAMMELRGLLPGSLLHVAPSAMDAPWAMSRFSPAMTAPRERVPIDAAAAGCTAVYFRRMSDSIKGRVNLQDLDWVPEVEILATPIDAPGAPVAVSAMAEDGTFHVGAIALGIQYEVIAVPAGMSIEMIPPALRQVITTKGSDVITIPLSLPIAR